MKIKKLLSTSLIFFLPFFFIIFIIFCINILIKDFNYSHKSHNIYPGEVNWVKYYYALNKKKISNFFINLNNNEEGLPIVKIYVPEKTSKGLMSDVPYSTKKYLNAEILINNETKKAQIRYLGDNPKNWMFNQKNIRLKLRKSELENRIRYFEYKVQPDILQRYTAYKFAKKLDLLVTDAKLVELFVNDKNVGIYTQTERLNESFLRRNKIMPINLYKGEAFMNSEKKIGLEFYLDQNPGLWEKISFYNQVEKADYTDLIRLFNNIKSAESSKKKLNQIIKFDNIEMFARASILEILLNAYNGDHIHNRRIAIDPWSGKIYIIPHDFTYNDLEIDEESFTLDKSFTNLFTVLHQSSKFLDFKYSILYQVIKEEKIFDKIIDDLRNLKDEYLVSLKTDLGSVHRKYVNNKIIDSENKNEKNYDNFIKALKKREKQIIDFLEKNPKASWSNHKKGFNIKIEKILPISNLIVKFNKKNPKWIILDYNNNQIIDEEDKYFYPNTNGNFRINLKLFANRIPVNNNILSASNEITTGNTKFTFFVEENIKPSELITFNNFTKNKISLEFNKNKASRPSINNIALLNNDEKEINILKGNIFLDKDLIIKNETEIKEGTNFTMAEGVSIIFENKVTAIGSIQKPIIFKKQNESKNWGTIAIHGKKTKGSFFKNVIIENASGKTINGINYFASLSVHSTKNINFDNILIKNNSKFDDMMHIIYSDNIQILNSNFLNAYADSIDVDISNNVLLKNTNIINSGNDGVDLMESKAELEEVNISYSGDKGVSVGENSRVLITNSIIKLNNIGVTSKDLSKAIIKSSLLENNKIQLSVYKKNWRYGGSGVINVENSTLTALENYIKSDKKGEISISSTNINGAMNKTQNIKVN
jgi:hypothetical protein